KVDLINSGQSPIVEADIGEILASTVASGRLGATDDVARAIAHTDLSLICVGTPSQPNGSLDLTFMRRVSEQIGCPLRAKRPGHTVVVRSTILPGTMNNMVIPILQDRSGKRPGVDF